MVNVALKLPNLFRRIFGEGALSSVFIPMYTQKKIVSSEDALLFSWNIIAWLVVLLGSIVVIMVIFMKPLMIFIAPGFIGTSDNFDVAVLLCQITIPYLVFISVAALIGGILNSERKFFAFAFVPCLLNIVIVGFTLLAQPYIEPSIAISISVLLGGMTQVAFMIFFLKKANIRMRFIFPSLNGDVKQFLSNMLPATVSAGVTQISLFISQSIASFAPGAIAVLSYADRIYQLPLSIIGTTLSTILLPELSKLKFENRDDAEKTKIAALKFGGLLSFPSAVGIIALAYPIIELIYERGAFTMQDTINTSNTIMIFAIGLPAFIFNKIYTSIFYAHQDTKTLMRITIYSLVISVILNLSLVWYFSYIGIAIGAVISSWCNVIMLHKYGVLHGYLSITRNVWGFMQKALIIALIMGLVVSMCYQAINAHILVSTVISVTVGIIIYFGILLSLKMVVIRNRKIILS